MAEDKQALIHRVVESVYNEGNLDVVDELYAPSVRINGEATDIEDFKQAMVMLREIVPGFRVTIEELQTKGDKVAAQWTIRRSPKTHRRGPPSSHVYGSCTGQRLFRIADGKVTDVWANGEAVDQIEQLGL